MELYLCHKFPFWLSCLLLLLQNTAIIIAKEDISSNDTTIKNLTVERKIPFCYIDLFLPDACNDTKLANASQFTKHLYALNIDLKAKAGNDVRAGVLSPGLEGKDGWNSSETSFCSVKETPTFPSNCIANKESIIFTDQVSCPNYDVFEMDRNYTYTTGLMITCIAPYPLELKNDKTIPYEGLKVRFAKIPVVNNSDLYYQIQLQIPGEFKPGNLHEYSGNYTFFSPEKVSLRRQLKIKIRPRNHGSNLSGTPDGDTPVINPSDGRIRCESKNKMAPVSLVVVQASNPMELKILRTCLEKDKTCAMKMVGKNCTTNHAHCQELIPTLQQGIIRCSCGSGGENTVEREFFMGLDLAYYKNFNEARKVPRTLIYLQHEDEMSYLEHLERDEDLEITQNASPLQVYDGGNFTFLCYFLEYLLVAPIGWTVEFKNGTSTDLVDVQNSVIFDEFHKETVKPIRAGYFHIRAAKAQVPVSLNMTSVRCRATFWNSSEYEESSMNLSVKASEKPAPWKSESVKVTKEISSLEFELDCRWKKVNPIPDYQWKFQGKSGNKSITQNDSCVRQWWNETTHSSHLYICNSNQWWNGTYICSATNFLGSATQKYDVKIMKGSSSTGSSNAENPWIYLGVAGVIIILLIAGFIVVLRVYRSQKAMLTALEIQAFEQGNKKALSEDKMAHEIAQYLPYNKDFEIPWVQFETDYEELGHGAYGIVVKGKIGDRVVAAKTVHLNVDKCAILALLSELKIMIYLEKHEYLVELVGACTEFLREGRPYIFVEFCSKGSLDSVLKKGRKGFVNQIPKEQRSNSVPTPDLNYINLEQFDMDEPTFSAESAYENVTYITTSDLIRWSCQIASAMEYLESKKVIHGDLATRNVLLSSTLDVKVTDFGLARQLNNYSIYVKTQETPLPWRWMALESLQDMIFTSKSDVWSYGITLWEIFTLAEIPYPGATLCDQFLEDLETGYRMRRPRYSTESIYEQILACWVTSPDIRPSFTELKEYFSTAKPHDYIVSNDRRVSDEGIGMSDASDMSPLL